MSANTPVRNARRPGGSDDPAQFHWLVVNGPSVAACPFPLPYSLVAGLEGAICLPRPHWLIGFGTAAEALAVQRFLLEAEIADIVRAQREWAGRADVAIVQRDSPDPPSPWTLWTVDWLR